MAGKLKFSTIFKFYNQRRRCPSFDRFPPTLIDFLWTTTRKSSSSVLLTINFISDVRCMSWICGSRVFIIIQITSHSGGCSQIQLLYHPVLLATCPSEFFLRLLLCWQQRVKLHCSLLHPKPTIRCMLHPLAHLLLPLSFMLIPECLPACLPVPGQRRKMVIGMLNSCTRQPNIHSGLFLLLSTLPHLQWEGWSPLFTCAAWWLLFVCLSFVEEQKGSRRRGGERRGDEERRMIIKWWK